MNAAGAPNTALTLPANHTQNPGSCRQSGNSHNYVADPEAAEPGTQESSIAFPTSQRGNTLCTYLLRRADLAVLTLAS
jgi:hypothetical protein